MEFREEETAKKTKFSSKSGSQAGKSEDPIDSEINQAIQNRDVKALRSLSSEMTKLTLKKMRTGNRK